MASSLTVYFKTVLITVDLTASIQMTQLCSFDIDRDMTLKKFLLTIQFIAIGFSVTLTLNYDLTPFPTPAPLTDVPLIIWLICSKRKDHKGC